MTQEFIPYEEALQLKELGYDEPCFGSFDIHSKQLYQTRYESEQNDFYLLAPLYQQVFRWFREKHQLGCEVRREYGSTYFGYIDNGVVWYQSGYGDSHEEVQLKLIRELINLIKNK